MEIEILGKFGEIYWKKFLWGVEIKWFFMLVLVDF